MKGFYICYETSQFDWYFFNRTKFVFEKKKCVRWNEYFSEFDDECYPLNSFDENIPFLIDDLYRELRSSHLVHNYSIKMCNQTSMYQCDRSLKCISIFRLFDGRFDCPYRDDEDLDIDYLRKTILFQHICDGFVDLLPRLIHGENHTDETECDQWECVNIYTHQNRIWNCPNGIDETELETTAELNCSLNEHFCVSIDYEDQ